jgi:hypothetical protein
MVAESNALRSQASLSRLSVLTEFESVFRCGRYVHTFKRHLGCNVVLDNHITGLDLTVCHVDTHDKLLGVGGDQTEQK